MVVNGNIAFRKNQLSQPHHIENLYAVQVSRPGKYPAEMSLFSLPQQTYAVFRHQGENSQIGYTLSLAFQWLSRSVYYLGDAPSMFRQIPGNCFSGELFLPISLLDTPSFEWWQGYSPIYLKNMGNAA